MELIIAIFTASLGAILSYTLASRCADRNREARVSYSCLAFICIGLHLADLTEAPTWPLTLPNAWVWLLLSAGIVSFNNRDCSQSSVWKINFGILLLLFGSSHPWWRLGVEGWLRLILLSGFGTLFITYRYRFFKSLQPSKWQSFIALLPIGLITPMLLGFANIAHLFSMLVLILPISILVLGSWLKTPINTAHSAWDWLPLSSLVLFGNAATRFVPSPERGQLERYCMDLAIFLVLIAPLAGFKRNQLQPSRVQTSLYLVTLFLGVAICLSTYLYESPTTSSGPDWNYDSF